MKIDEAIYDTLTPESKRLLSKAALSSIDHIFLLRGPAIQANENLKASITMDYDVLNRKIRKRMDNYFYED